MSSLTSIDGADVFLGSCYCVVPSTPAGPLPRSAVLQSCSRSAMSCVRTLQRTCRKTPSRYRHSRHASTWSLLICYPVLPICYAVTPFFCTTIPIYYAIVLYHCPNSLCFQSQSAPPLSVHCLVQGHTVTLKLKTVLFEVKTRAVTLPRPVAKTEELYLAARDLLAAEVRACAPSPLRLRLMGQSSLSQHTASNARSLHCLHCLCLYTCH